MTPSRTLVGALVAAFAVTLVTGASAARPDLGRRQSSATAVRVQEYSVPAGSHPHDVAPAPDGSVWYTARPRAASDGSTRRRGRRRRSRSGTGRRRTA